MTSTASLPGTGLSYRQHVGFNSGPRHSDNEPIPSFVPTRPPSRHAVINPAVVETIHSASTERMTSERLQEVKQLLQHAYQQHEEVNRELDSALTEKVSAESRFESWDGGFLLKRIFKKKFLDRKESAEIAAAKVNELEEQRSLSRIDVNIDLDEFISERYYLMRDAFAGLSECGAIWDVKTRQATDRFHDRTTAEEKLTRERVRFELSQCDLMRWIQEVPHLKNAKGGDIYLYPGFILYRAAKQAFSLLDYHDVRSSLALVRFQDEDQIPSDSRVTGHTWAKSNKDGSRDKRFANNYQIPIAEYIRLELRSGSGLWEEFHFSNPEKMCSFIDAFNVFTSSFLALPKSA